MKPALRRNIALGGLLFVILFVVSIVIVPSTPGSHDSALKVVQYYHDHKTVVQVSAYLIEVAVFVGVVFFWYLRELLSRRPESRRLATLGFAGVLLFAVDGGLSAGINWAAADAVNHVSFGTMQTMNVLQNFLTSFLAGAGSAIFLAATGLAVVRSNLLPRWLGWIGVVLAVVSLVLPFLGVAAVGLWTLIACVVLLVTHEPREQVVQEPPVPRVPPVPAA